MIAVDTNVIIDVLQDDPRWASWSGEQLAAAHDHGDVIACPVVVAELSRDFADLARLRAKLSALQLTSHPLDDRAAFLAGHRCAKALDRRGVSTPRQPLADFFIGAHASVLGCPLLTRDTRLYRRYFPELTLITPETYHG